MPSLHFSAATTALILLVQPTLAEAQGSLLADHITTYARTHNFSGAILVAHDGRVVYQRAFGLADRSFRVPARVSTRFRIASITKLFTATLILQLVDDGKVRLADSIAAYLPRYGGEGKDRVTVEQLLHHTSGLQNSDTVSSYEAAARHGLDLYQLPHPSEELLDRYASGPLVSQPGTTFDYNNADYIVLGKIIESVTGLEYATALSQRILIPLGMSSTGMASYDQVVDSLATSYFRAEADGPLSHELPVYYENWYAAGGLFSTVADLRRFADALYRGSLLTVAGRERLLAPGPGEYGCGLYVWDLDIAGKAHPVAYRPGRIMGTNTALYRVLDQDLTIVILGNTNLTSIDDFAPFIAKAVLE